MNALAVMTLIMLSAACASKAPYPATWDTHSDGAWCSNPSGTFANTPFRSDLEGADSDEGKLELKEVFFGSELNGFDVTHLSFDTLESGLVLVRPWVGEHVLEEERRLNRRRKPCDDGSWRVKSDWAAMPGTALEGLLWTGGILIPMAARATFELNLTARGDLTVRAIVYAAGTTFLVFPMRARLADEWYLYRRWTPHPVDHIQRHDDN